MLLKERKEEEKEAERIRSELGSSKGLMQEREREEEEDGRKKKLCHHKSLVYVCAGT